MSAQDNRKRLLAAIHATAKQRGLDDKAYRDTIQNACGVRSCIDLEDRDLIKVLEALKKPRRRLHNRTDRERGPLLRKIEAQLGAAGRSLAYADGIARRRFQKERLEFCSAAELSKIVAMLVYDARRHGRPA